MQKQLLFFVSALVATQAAHAALIVDPNDARSWQGATVGTFAQLYYGSDTLANRQLVVTNQLLDDSYFNASGYSAATMIKYNGGNPNATGSYGTSLDQPNSVNAYQGSYGYTCCAGTAAQGGNAIDNLWIQVNNVIGASVWDLGFQATKAAIFNTIDHGPMPQEAIESTVYLSNDMINWTQAVTERVWMEGFYSDTSLLWDGFAYAVGTGSNDTFRYASIIWGGPGSLIQDGDNEINGVMGLRANFEPGPGNGVPEPGTLALLGLGLAGLGYLRRRQPG
jgi:hypothetical protein